MENNNAATNPVTETSKTNAATGNSNIETAIEEVVIYDECGDTLWDKVLAQTDKTDSLEKKLQQPLNGK